ncbi:Choline-sulfatase [Planctomycetales bacterium 10988]|nr:Choline-sulfatase [Planctomycetales bacterium 10988]
MLRFLLFLFALFGAVSITSAKRPNVLVIMVDDLGYSDLGCYGSEIDTPQLDALAEGGLRFSQFYNTAKCHSSRVSLLTGQYCIAAGDVKLSHAVTSAEVLQNGGYFTAMTGKWHLREQPTDFGFQRYFGHLSGACNYFYGDNTFRLNGEPWQVPQEDFYTTVADVDYALDFLQEARQTQQPWYLYVAFNAPHAPLQALPEDYAKYKGKYDVGWDVIRKARVKRQKQLGLFEQDFKVSPRPEHIPAWEEVPQEHRDFEIKRMTALAAMIDRVDQEVGRLVKNLKETGEFENTLILFVSDNGACPYNRRSDHVEAIPTSGDVRWSDSTGWAWARNTPFRYYKQNQFEGGVSTPGIVHWPQGLKTKPGAIVHEPAHLIDVMPTLADVCQCEIPQQWEDRELRPVSGQSLLPIFKGENLKRTSPIHLLFATDRGLRDGDWKLVSFRGEAWELYNLAKDRAELNNLAESEPERLKAMSEQWTDMAKEVLHTSKQTFAPVRPAKLPHTHPEWTNFSLPPGTHARKGAGNQPAKKSARTIRARKNTHLSAKGNELHLIFTGDDPGLAFDHLGELPPGPYHLSFRVLLNGESGGEVYFTTDPKTKLPKGVHLPFEIGRMGNWQTINLPIQTEKPLYALRLDVCDGVGKAVVADLKLLSKDDKVLWQWPPLKSKQ